MFRKRLFMAVFIALLMLAGYNVLLHLAVKKSQRGRFLAAIDRLPPSTEVLFVGNSLIAAGCDVAVFQSEWSKTNEPPRAVNLGLGDTTPVEHYLALKRAFSRQPRVKYVVYGFFDDQLMAPVHGDWENLVGNRAFSYSFPEDAAAFYSPGSRLGRWKMELIGHIPMLAERSSPWERVELLRRRLDQIGMPEKKINRFGRVSDFNADDAGAAPDFTRRCEAALQRNAGFSPPIQAIIRLAREHGAKVFLVEMPLSLRHRERFYSLPAWAGMRARVQSLASAEGVVYVAASDWVQDGGNFEDDMHLNEQGARCFSAQLATEMSRMVSAGTTNALAHGKNKPDAVALSN